MSRFKVSYQMVKGGKTLAVVFDANGIVDLLIDGAFEDCDGAELNAIAYDHLLENLPAGHPVRHHLEANQ